jgi:hypothetical protein
MISLIRRIASRRDRSDALKAAKATRPGLLQMQIVAEAFDRGVSVARIAARGDLKTELSGNGAATA